eukprot:8890463-Heterocapsa_arctica.AAC.1
MPPKAKRPRLDSCVSENPLAGRVLPGWQKDDDLMHMGPTTLEDVLNVPAAHVRRLLRYADAADLPTCRHELQK